MGEEEKAKKPIWKRWWVWALVIILAIAVSSPRENTDSPATTPITPSSTGNQNTGPTTPPAPEPEPQVTSYKAGMYKIGSDLPAGEYVLISSRSAYFEITKDSSGSFESILANDNFVNRSIVTVSDGQYLKFQNGTAYAFADAPKAETNDGVLPEGMYKVGVDLPAGEYKIISSGSGYVEVTSNSIHDLGNIVSNDNFEGERYITVKDGQYLKLARASINVE